MFRKAAILVIAWYTIAIILPGCCNCPQPGSFRFRWTKLDITVRPYTLDSGYVSVLPDSTTDFTMRNPMFRTLLDYELIAKGRGCSGLMGQAYACKCAQDEFTPENNFSNLRVYTINAYDSTHPAMSDVTAYFGEFNNVPPDTVLQPMVQLHPLPSYSGSARLEWVMYLGKRPAFAGYHQFRVVYTLTDSSRISAVTEPLQF